MKNNGREASKGVVGFWLFGLGTALAHVEGGCLDWPSGWWDCGRCVGVRRVFEICSNVNSALKPDGGPGPFERCIFQRSINAQTRWMSNTNAPMYFVQGWWDHEGSSPEPGRSGSASVRTTILTVSRSTAWGLCCTQISNANWPVVPQIQKPNSKTTREMSEAPFAIQGVCQGPTAGTPPKRTPPFPTRAEPQGTREQRPCSTILGLIRSAALRSGVKRVEEKRMRKEEKPKPSPSLFPHLQQPFNHSVISHAVYPGRYLLSVPAGSRQSRGGGVVPCSTVTQESTRAGPLK